MRPSELSGLCRCSGLTRKLFGLARIKLPLSGNLDGNGPIQFIVKGLEDGTEGPRTDLLDKLEVSNRLGAGFVRRRVLVADESKTAATVGGRECCRESRLRTDRSESDIEDSRLAWASPPLEPCQG